MWGGCHFGTDGNPTHKGTPPERSWQEPRESSPQWHRHKEVISCCWGTKWSQNFSLVGSKNPKLLKKQQQSSARKKKNLASKGGVKVKPIWFWERGRKHSCYQERDPLLWKKEQKLKSLCCTGGIQNPLGVWSYTKSKHNPGVWGEGQGTLSPQDQHQTQAEFGCTGEEEHKNWCSQPLRCRSTGPAQY